MAQDNFSARYDLDRIKGTFSRPAHKLYGQSYVGQSWCWSTAKGGVASAWMLREMAARGMAPKAIVFDRTNTILAQGAAFADLTMVDRFEAGDPTTLIRTGDELDNRARRGPRHDPQSRRLVRACSADAGVVRCRHPPTVIPAKAGTQYTLQHWCAIHITVQLGAPEMWRGCPPARA